jgi:hypothetical protein
VTKALYDDILGKVSQTDSAVLHSGRIVDLIQLTQQNLDVYLASAVAIMELEEDPG